MVEFCNYRLLIIYRIMQQIPAYVVEMHLRYHWWQVNQSHFQNICNKNCKELLWSNDNGTKHIICIKWSNMIQHQHILFLIIIYLLKQKKKWIIVLKEMCITKGCNNNLILTLIAKLQCNFASTEANLMFLIWN